jgi:formate dehydrogenase subunit gamma
MGARLIVVACVMLLAAAGSAGAQSQAVPPPAALRPAAPPLAAAPPVEAPVPPPTPAWRTFLAYRQALRWAGGTVLASTLLLLAAHFAVYGTHHVRPTGLVVRRYDTREIVLHALLALAFVGAWASSTYLVLAKYVFGYSEAELPVPLGRASSAVHLAAGLAFLLSLLALGRIWWRSMRFEPHDAAWLRALGGYFSRHRSLLPAGRFNAGQKVWFRLALLVGALVALSGGLLYYPALFGPGAGIVLFIVHTALGVLLSAAVVTHVYLAAFAHPCALRAMITGTIDEACLREDHPLQIVPRPARPSG